MSPIRLTEAAAHGRAAPHMPVRKPRHAPKRRSAAGIHIDNLSDPAPDR
jgi:hypothetical protein